MNNIKQKSIRRLSALFLVFMLAGVLFTACKDEFFDDSVTHDLPGAPTLTAALTSAGDSTVVFSYTQSVAGWLSYGVLSGEGNTVPEDDELLTSALSADKKGGFKVTADNLSGTVTVSGLMPNSDYEIFVISANVEGVVSDVQGPLAFSTSDNVAPSLDGTTPAVSETANKALGFDVTLNFDESVKVLDESKFIFSYLDMETLDLVEVTADSANASGKNVIVYQAATNIHGQYVFLTVEDGAVADITGNTYDGITSGLDTEDLPEGLYWRISLVDFTFNSSVPEDGEIITAPDFAFKLNYGRAIAINDDYTKDMVKIKYTVGNVVTETLVDESYLEVVDDTVLVIKFPILPDHGQAISLYVEEGVALDIYDNPVSEVAYGDISCNYYGYDRTHILGNYTMNGTSYWDGGDESLDITIEADPGSDNGIIINGFLGSTESIIGEFDGDYGTITISIDEQSLGDIFGDGSEVLLILYDGVIECQIDPVGDMVCVNWWGFYVEPGLGWYNIYTSSEWVKEVPPPTAAIKSPVVPAKRILSTDKKLERK
ncbi:MAG: hypothetical protein JXJ22_12315 [Bacteroidales bacterium]|nr:hypothetical protein [Bacteroidales bacterium]